MCLNQTENENFKHGDRGPVAFKKVYGMNKSLKKIRELSRIRLLVDAYASTKHVSLWTDSKVQCLALFKIDYCCSINWMLELIWDNTRQISPSLYNASYVKRFVVTCDFPNWQSFSLYDQKIHLICMLQFS